MFTANPETQSEKVKVIVNPSVRMDPSRLCCAAMAMEIIEQACSSYHVADRGHKSKSKEESIVEFHISYGKPNLHVAAKSKELDPSAAPFVPSSSGNIGAVTVVPVVPVVISTSEETIIEEEIGVDGGDVLSDVASWPDLDEQTPVTSHGNTSEVVAISSHVAGGETSFAYLEEYRGAGNKYERVINLFLNKLGSYSSYKDNLDSLGKYFSDQLPELAAFLKNMFSLPISSWDAIVALVTRVVENDTIYHEHDFTLAAVFSDINAVQSLPFDDLSEMQQRAASVIGASTRSKSQKKKIER